MAYTFANLKTDLRSYTEVDDTVLTDALCSTITKNAENRIYREAPPHSLTATPDGAVRHPPDWPIE